MEFWHKRGMISKVLSTSSLNGQTRSESPNPSPSSTQWFVKVVSTICIHHPQSLAILNSDYFRYNLDPSVAYGVIYLLNRMDDPSLSCSFFCYTRLNLDVEHNYSSFNLLLRSLCRANLIDLAKTVYDYMRADRVRLDKSLLDNLISSFSIAGKFGIAEDILITRAELSDQRKETVSPFVYNRFLSLLISRNQLEKAVAFFRDHILKSPAFRPDQFTFSIVIRGMCVAGQVEKAFEIFTIMKSSGCHPDLVTYNTLINALCRVGKADGAQDLLREIQYQSEFSPDVVTYSSVISGYCKLGKMEYVKSLFDEMFDCGIMPNTYTFNAIIDGFAKAGQVEKAFEIFTIMKSSGCHPDLVTYNTLINGLCRVGKAAIIDGFAKAGQVEKAFEIFAIMKSSGCHPDLVTYNTLINGLCRVGKADGALDLLREIQYQSEFSPDVVTYSSVISGYCKLGKMEYVESLFDEMLDCGIMPNTYTFNAIIGGFAKIGKMTSALKIYERMVSSGVLPNAVTFTCLMGGYSRVGEFYECMKILNEMNKRNISPDAHTCSVIVNALCKWNRLNEACSLLRQLNGMYGIILQPIHYNPVIDLLCKAGRIDEANVIVSEMEASGCTHDVITYTILICGHCMEGRMFEAVRIYSKMLSVGCAPDNITKISFVSFLRKAGMAHEANVVEDNAWARSSSSEKKLYTKRMFGLLQSAYSKISIQDTARFLGKNEEEAANYVVQHDWSLDPCPGC